MSDLSRRKLLKLTGGGAIGAGAAYTGLALYDDTPPDCLIPPCPPEDLPVINGSTIGFNWDETFTDTSWVASAGLDLNFERVTTLDPTGSGSIGQAIENAVGQPTVIVFEVGGAIDLSEADDIKLRSARTWIAGETAPSPGITITRGMLSVTAPQCIVSHISVLTGDETSEASDGISIEADDVLIDHCTGMWGTDEVAGAADSISRVSFLNCIIAEGLHDSIHPEGPHSRGMHFNNGGTGICIMGCLFAHNSRRNPLSRADIVLVNNYIYNFGNSDGNIMAFNPPETPDVTAKGLHVDPGSDSSPSLEVFQFSARLYHDDIRTSPDSRPITDGSQVILEAPPIRPRGLDLEAAAVPAADVRQFVTGIAGPRPVDRPQVEADLINHRLNDRHGIIDSQEAVGGYPGYTSTRRTLDIQDERSLDVLVRRRQAVEQGRRRESDTG